jgi:hypothetical protein
MGGTSGRLLDFMRGFLALIIMRIDIVWIPGLLFLKRFKEAFKMSGQQADVFEQFSATFTPAVVKKWEAIVTAWNANPKARNPYQEPKSGELFKFSTNNDLYLNSLKELPYKMFVYC